MHRLLALVFSALALISLSGPAQASTDCDESLTISDLGEIIDPKRLPDLTGNVSALIERYKVPIFVCLSNARLERSVEEEADDILERLAARASSQFGTILLYINSSGRTAYMKGSGAIRTQWGDDLKTLILLEMLPDLKKNDYGASIEAGLEALESKVLRWVAAPATSPISGFSANVLTHVLFHELAHALMREFDIPVLGNEEDLADRFANYWISQIRDVNWREVLLDRVRSWVLEDSQQEPRILHFKSEHPLDIRRAFQTGCYLYGADPAENHSLVEWMGFSEDDLEDCIDTTPDQIDGWASVVKPLLLKGGQHGAGVSLEYRNIDPLLQQQLDGLLQDVLADMRLFNWPQPIKLVVDSCEGTASWSRKKLSITLCTKYIYRFYRQGLTLSEEPNILSEHLQKEALP